VSATERVELVETPDRDGAFPRLSEEQIARLAEQGQRREVAAGDVLYREGDRDYDFYVVLSGKVATVEGYGETDEIIAVHGPGRFLGELSLLTGEAALVSAVVMEDGEVLAIPAERLRKMVSLDSTLGDLILRACLLRRTFLIGVGAGFRIIGSRYSPDTRRLRDFAARNRLPHRWLDLEEDATAEALLREFGVKPEETPVVIVGSNRILRNPSNAELAEVIGLRPSSPPEAVCDLLVVGAGPGGLAASVYGASEGLTTTAVDAVATGGQAATSPRIENYLGFPAGISGGELADRATIQARKFGARVTVPAEAKALRREDGHYVVTLDDGSEIHAETVVIATGARYCKLPVPRLEELEGTSIYYAATLAEAQMCAGDPVAVVGGGNAAGQATLFLSQHAARVYLLLRSDDLGKGMSRYLADRIERNPNVEVMLNTEVRELVGERTLEALVVEDNRTGERRTIEARALFVFIGAEPHTDWLGDAVALDRRGFILTGRDVPASATSDGHEPMLLETSLPGVLAVGDVRSGSIKRVASAVGEGAMAVRLVHEHLNGHNAQLER
jgi:thioredoxin reductase (NADPH)